MRTRKYPLQPCAFIRKISKATEKFAFPSQLKKRRKKIEEKRTEEKNKEGKNITRQITKNRRKKDRDK
jgi:hypothetical protein